MTTSVVVHPDFTTLAEAAAARLLTRVLDAQAARGVAHVVLTGGGIGIAALAALAENPARRAVDWDAVHLWWGDERFLPSGDLERNHTQADDALLGRLPIPANRVHPMPARDAAGDDLEQAARRYATHLAGFAPGNPELPPVPEFDVVLLGVGPDGHVASLFPGHPGADERDRMVIGVRNAPKPPPDRLSLTVPALQQARQIWLLASGTEKRRAVAEAVENGADCGLPAGIVRGRERTLWLVDLAAAALVPARFLRPERNGRS